MCGVYSAVIPLSLDLLKHHHFSPSLPGYAEGETGTAVEDEHGGFRHGRFSSAVQRQRSPQRTERQKSHRRLGAEISSVRRRPHHDGKAGLG